MYVEIPHSCSGNPSPPHWASFIINLELHQSTDASDFLSGKKKKKKKQDANMNATQTVMLFMVKRPANILKQKSLVQNTC